MQTGLGSSPFARRYWGNRYYFLFLRVLRCFNSPRSPPPGYGFTGGCPDITRDGFPHSEIPGSKFVCNYPRLIAAYHVLRRLLVPRHPPCALSNLIGILSIPNDTQNDIEDARFLILYEVVKDQIQPCFLAKPNKISKSFNGDNPASCGITFPRKRGGTLSRLLKIKLWWR